MDLSQMDDSPVLWIRLDPDMTLIRSLDIVQPDFQWQYQEFIFSQIKTFIQHYVRQHQHYKFVDILHYVLNCSRIEHKQ